jgi:hypothetical protein
VRVTRLLLAGYGSQETPARVVSSPSTSHTRDDCRHRARPGGFLLKEFTRLGSIERAGRGPLTINRSVLSVVLRD